MPHVNYEIPEPLHRALKMRAAELGWTLKQLVVFYLQNGLIEDEYEVG